MKRTLTLSEQLDQNNTPVQLGGNSYRLGNVTYMGTGMNTSLWDSNGNIDREREKEMYVARQQMLSDSYSSAKLSNALAKIKELEEKNARQVEQLKVKDDAIAEKDSVIRDKDNIIQELPTKPAGPTDDEILETMNQALSELRAVKTESTDKDRLLEEQANTIVERDNALAEKDSIISQKDSINADLRRDLYNSDVKLEKAESDIQKLESNQEYFKAKLDRAELKVDKLEVKLEKAEKEAKFKDGELNMKSKEISILKEKIAKKSSLSSSKKHVQFKDMEEHKASFSDADKKSSSKKSSSNSYGIESRNKYDEGGGDVLMSSKSSSNQKTDEYGHESSSNNSHPSPLEDLNIQVPSNIVAEQQANTDILGQSIDIPDML